MKIISAMNLRFLRLCTVSIAIFLFSHMTGYCSENLEKEYIPSTSITQPDNNESIQGVPNFNAWTFFPAIGAVLVALVGILVQNNRSKKNILSQLKANEKKMEKLFFLQKHHEDSRLYIPIVLELLQDLNIVHSFLIFRGSFCPFIEHRSPVISMDDPDPINRSSSNNIHAMSIAQREHQFISFGMKIIDNCRRIIFLVKDEELPETKKICSEIINELFHKTKGSKTKLEILQLQIQECIKGTTTDPNMERLKEVQENLNDVETLILNFYDRLEATIALELPRLGS